MTTTYQIHSVTSNSYAVIGVTSSLVTGRTITTRTVAWHDTMDAALADAMARNAAPEH